MNNKKVRHRRNKSRVICLLLFCIETAGLAAIFYKEAVSWQDTSYVSALNAQIFIGACLLLLTAASLVICLSFYRLALEKKILILLGFVAISLGIIGISGLVFENEISFIDAIYKTLQLFVGEFGDINYEVGTFPLYLNISRFLALFVTFGAIIILLAKEKFLKMSIRLIYRDTLIITDQINSRTLSLINKLQSNNRHVVIGLVDASLSNVVIDQGDSYPIISFNSEKEARKGLIECNIKRAKCVFLLCKKTSENIHLYRSVLPLLSKSVKFTHKDDIEKNKTDLPLHELFEDYRKILASTIFNNQNSSKSRKTIFYIHYLMDSEKEYYSLDESLAVKNNSIETYFINFTDTAIRQMISRISLFNIAFGNLKQSYSDPAISLRNLKIGVSGSGELFYSTLKEISHLCVFTDKPPLTIYNLFDSNAFDSIRGTSARGPLKPLLNLVDIPIQSSSGSHKVPEILFICSEDVVQIRALIHSIFQNGLSSYIKEYIILTDCSQIDMDILIKYIDSLSSAYRNNLAKHNSPPYGAVLHLANLVNLIMTTDDFYKAYGPDFRKVHSAYLSSINNGKPNDFNKLPELFIESTILNSIHNRLLIDLTRHLNSIDPSLLTDDFLEFITATEHERWFNERTLRHFNYSETTDYMLNLNSYLQHWQNLTRDKQEDNIRYVIKGLIAQADDSHNSYELTLQGHVHEYKLHSTLEDF